MTGAEQRKPSVVLVDDHESFLDGFELVVKHDGRLRVAGRAGDSASAVALVGRTRPEVVCLDADVDATPAQANICSILRVSPRTRVVILTMHTSAVLRSALLRAGAVAVLSKSHSIFIVVDTLFAVASGAAPSADSPRASRPQVLSPRECEVLMFVERALSNKQIAEQLSITEGTVKRHASTAFAKLGVRSRAEAVQTAKLLGLI